MTMTFAEVNEILGAHGVEDGGLHEALQPQGGTAEQLARVRWFPVPLPDGSYLGVSWTFGTQEEDWNVRYHAVEGPMTLDELKELADGG